MASTAVCDKRAGQANLKSVEILVEHWESLTNIWHKDRLAELVASLARQQLLRIDILENTVVISDKATSQESLTQESAEIIEVSSNFEASARNSRERSPILSSGTVKAPVLEVPVVEELTQVLPVYDVPPAPAAMPLPKRQQDSVVRQGLSSSHGMLKERGPAPSFGGSTGWKKRSGDALQTIFAQQEVLNKQLHPMTMNWKPSAMFYSTLHRNGIAKEFSDNCLDEFILFYCDKNTKERSWDQKFLAWVKRDWIKQQSKDNRVSSQQQSGPKNENSQRDTREKRKRITAAIMDIHDTNW